MSHECRANGVDGHKRERGVGALHLIEQDELVGGGPALTTELNGPSQPQPAISTHASHDLAEQRAALATAADLVAYLGGQQLGKVLTQFLAQGLLFG